ncbi:hypothetical protein NCER_101373 [Vairimorpha ceranae BRL01]|uniref:Protein kinase domain-containing protein n=1 Tax=Vairimorpha ceranae (strain BRL01) TaxID=578460 RepID=C4V9V8_VAIC1|nr:hypothetical protein NCER_101373 [Vairimorpha ceranae BRL01]
MKYIFKNIIGEGACGKVYKALDSYNNPVSIKIIPKNKKSYNEIKILSSVNHDNICKYLDVYESLENLYLVTELCEYNLITFINEYNVDINITKKIIRMILCGLEYLHSNNIIHRDIKLANILIKENSIKICDFGLSCYASKNNFSVCGTEDYIAPEIINKESYTKSVDIYSAGKVFSTLLDLKNVTDPCCNDLLGRMLDVNPVTRITAYDALHHPVFQDFLPKYCDFRYLNDFKVDEKFGIIQKINDKVYFDEISLQVSDTNTKNITDNTAFFCDKSKVNTQKLKLCYLKHDEIEELHFIFKLNEQEKEIFLFTNAHLKKIIYGLAYLNLKMERLPIILIEEKDYKFVYQLNEGFIYYDANFIVKKKHTKAKKSFFYEVADLENKTKKKCDILPKEIQEKKIFELFYKCQRNIINIDYKNLPLKLNNEKLEYPFAFKNSTISMGTLSSVGSFMDMKIRNEIFYKFKNNLGWCIKKKTNFVFLLNDGRCFEIELSKMLVKYNNKNYEINNRLPMYIKKDLKRINDLVKLYL